MAMHAKANAGDRNGGLASIDSEALLHFVAALLISAAREIQHQRDVGRRKEIA
ncbi:hypothetical protein OAF37_02565 [Rubripirellula sp.]|nr:hypothetical protein [Rubripirellula sp.]MDB4644920.1 hypothetical protein [Rubripirellula sp.]